MFAGTNWSGFVLCLQELTGADLCLQELTGADLCCVCRN